jgi:putative transposase
MPNYHRSLVEGGIYFFTVVTFQRQPIFTNETARNILHQAWQEVKEGYPFETIAVCLLPEHLHCIWRLPEGDADYSTRWKEIKRRFTIGYLRDVGPGGERNASRLKQQEAAIWQRRFWEHTIENEEDLEEHLDYVHYNPIKHGLVERVIDWPYSSFARYVKAGIYDKDWVGGDVGRLELLGWDL